MFWVEPQVAEVGDGNPAGEAWPTWKARSPQAAFQAAGRGLQDSQ
jgi:hypothetical protein